MRRSSIFAAVAGIALIGASGAQAATTTYTDRSAFEAALAGVTVDDFSDFGTDGFGALLMRSDYSISGSYYTCVASFCGDNSGIGFEYPGYLWNYVEQTILFDSAVNGVGFDFGMRGGSTTQVTLGGEVGPTAANSTFFGIISDMSFTTINYNLSAGSGSLMDNLTYGTIDAPVPLPATGLLLAGAIAAAAGVRRRKSA